jgi:uncharacterized protein
MSMEDSKRGALFGLAFLLAGGLLLIAVFGCHTDQQATRAAGVNPPEASAAGAPDSPRPVVGAASADANKQRPSGVPSPKIEDGKKMATAGWIKSLERSLLFFPAKFPEGDWQPPGLVFEDARFTAPDGVGLHGWFVPCERPRAVVLFAHGNGGNLSHRADLLRALHDRMRVAAMIFDYRGYGRSEGSPDAAGILVDGRAARAWLADRVKLKENQIVLMGESLGGAVAVDLAAADGARGLVLDSTFSSLPDVAGWHYPWLPLAKLMQTRLDSAGKIAAYHGPLLMFHGDHDQTIPIQFGRRLFEAANEPKRFVVMPGHDHNDPRPAEFFRELDEFFDSLK